ncbi:MAG: hypothetical protein M1820_006053 [Bogoriella megaspora]|nr:MAG: hypothetical protein M1820_006053 [Bogoriella megaspora]
MAQDEGLQSSKKNVQDLALAETAIPTTETSAANLDDAHVPHLVRLRLLMGGACLAAFLVGLDQTIITTAIPRITDDFHSPEDVGWYGSAYLLSSCAFQPVYGQVYKQFNVRNAYFFALAAFLLGSLICAVAPTSTALVIGRAFAGLGCAGVLTGNLSMVAISAPLQKRPIYISMLGTIFGIGLVCGPIIGGTLTSQVSWRWCFWINLPVGALTIVCIIVLFRPAKHTSDNSSLRGRIASLDLFGSLLAIAVTVMLLLALQWGGVTFPWSHPTMIGLLVGSGAGALIFVLWQYHRGTEALMPLKIVCHRTVASTVASAFFQSGATFVAIFYLPYWFQVVKDASPVDSGVDMIPWMVSNFLSATATSVVVTKTGSFNPPLIAGLAIATIGSGLFTTVFDEYSTGRWIGFEILSGAGLGAARQQYFLAVQAVLPSSSISIGIALVLFSQNLAGAIFVSVSNSLIRNRVSSSLSQWHISGVDGAAILTSGTTSLVNAVPHDQLPMLIRLFNRALQDVFILSIPLVGLALVCSLPMEWKNLRRQHTE